MTTALGLTLLLLASIGITTIIYQVKPLIQRLKKRGTGVPKNSNPPQPPTRAVIYINGLPVVGCTPVRFKDEIKDVTTKDILNFYGIPPNLIHHYKQAVLRDQLYQALDKEDYEEAARLRDLINQTKP